MKQLIILPLIALLPWLPRAIGQSAIRPKVDSLLEAADSLRDEGSNFAASLEAANRALELSKNAVPAYQKGMADSYMRTGRAKKGQGEYAQAMSDFERALSIRQNNLKDTLGMASCANNLAGTALKMGARMAALNYAKLAVSLAQDRPGGERNLTKYYNTLARAFREYAPDSLNLAVAANEKSMSFFTGTRDTAEKVKSEYGIAQSMIDLGNFPAATGHLDTAALFLTKMDGGDSILLGQVFEARGVVEMNLPAPDLDTALAYFEKAKAIYLRFPEAKNFVANVFFNIAEANEIKGDLSNARANYDQSLRFGVKNGSDLPDFSQIIEGRLKTLETQNDRDGKAKLLTKSLCALLLISMVLAILAVMFYRKERELHKLRHDIVKNDLLTIDGYISHRIASGPGGEAGNALLPMVYEVKFMVRRMLWKIGYPIPISEAVSLKPFAREMCLWAEKVLLRPVQDYTFYDELGDFPMSKALRSELEAIVTECFTNIRKYAEPTKATICFLANENGLTMTIEDDGIGFDPLKVAKSGLRNIRSRASAVHGTFDLVSAPGSGTKIAIHIRSFPERT